MCGISVGYARVSSVKDCEFSLAGLEMIFITQQPFRAGYSVSRLWRRLMLEQDRGREFKA